MTPQARASAMRNAWDTFYENMKALEEEGYSTTGFFARRIPGSSTFRDVPRTLNGLSGRINITKTSTETL